MEIDVKSIDHVLTTTRSVRRRLDLSRPVPTDVLEEAIELALQAPTGANSQSWRFVIVTDPEKRARIADCYRRGSEIYARGETGLSRIGMTAADALEGPRRSQMERIVPSAVHLMERLQDVPVLVILCIEGRVEREDVFTQASAYGSILPAAWSLMLALRSRGLASAWTTLHLLFEREVAEVIGIPPEYTQAVLLPVAYAVGTDFRPAKRLPAREVTYWDRWGERR
ncbi:MAG: hypothetical protein QOD06_2813 [Candidatus Binatota bacterium]|nr:hypothetical protein [Candidatus Binatota bacterium]